MSVNFEYDESVYNYSAAEEVLPLLIEKLHPSSVLDVGCGLGTWLKVAKDLGIKEVFGIDGASKDKEQLKISPDEFSEIDLRRPLNLSKKFDLVLCLEVVEHLPPECAEILIQSLCNHADIVLFSAAIPNQGGCGHVNEQWPKYWIDLFAKKGFKAFDYVRPFFWENEKVDLWYRQNMILFSNNDLSKKFNLPDFRLLPLVHPALLQCKLEEIANLKQAIEDIKHWDPGVRKAFKMLRKALIKKIKL